MAEHKTQTEAPTDGPPTDHAEAARLLRLIAGDGPVTFQTFDDDDTRKQRRLAWQGHGTLTKYGVRLDSLNSDGAGVFFMVNEGDGKGRKARNVRTVRAVFADLDGAPLEPVLACELRPHAVVETSPGKFHAYWCVDGLPLELFKSVQKTIARRFGSDPSVNDLCRVTRLPGFIHCKAGRFRSRILHLSDRDRYDVAELLVAFPATSAETLPPRPASRGPLPDVIPVGERNNRLFNAARGFLYRGVSEPEANRRIQTINQERCHPPLSAAEVDDIVRSAYSEGSRGDISLPHAVYDSARYRRLSLHSKVILLGAYRRFTGTNNGKICLQHEDFADDMSRKSFYTHRKPLIEGGWLVVAEEHKFSDMGRTPDLFALAYLPSWARGPS
ncbi:DNA-primase RepB domain-containing protein [Pseudoxanthomonas mexicana]|uniref:DNA-primase RepB domain-containing protein n=1 Tax=Pseudoxanthomonas mexicana TaxID=128785 RepID=UPI0022F3E7B9|nr:DNA-primase RepB domain-containing protein [Pseudoxanthomonas mexicana]WBX92819.1 DNA-primase RepB domain-containing protein [Pseudoxanthomonas mexicana]